MKKRNYAGVIVVACLIVFLAACGGKGKGKNGSGGTTVTGNMTLTGPGGQPLLSNALNFAAVVGTTSPPQTIMITNNTNVTVTLVQVAAVSPFVVSPPFNAPVALAVGQSTTINIVFNPTTPGQIADQVTFSFDLVPVAFGTMVGFGSVNGTAVTVQPGNLSFPAVATGTTSAPQSVVITNAGTSTVTVKSATTVLPFATPGFVQFPLLPTKSLNISVTYSPTTATTSSGTLTIAFDIAPSAMISLSGTGTTASALCTGTPITQTQTNITPLLSSAAPGVTAIQLTDNAANAPTFSDVQAYSAPTNQIVYNHFPTGLGGQVVSARPDGTGAQIISTGNGTIDAVVTPDGQFVYYQKVTAGSTDLFEVNLAHAGACVENQITNLHMMPASPNTSVQVSTAGIVEAGFATESGKHATVVAPASLMTRVVLEDGFILNQGIDPPDALQGHPYHRIRLNPQFGNWVAYQRQDPNQTVPAGVAQAFLYNFDTGQLAQINFGTTFGNMDWSPDGTTVGYVDTNLGTWDIVPVLNSIGQPISNFVSTIIGPSFKTGLTADSCNFSVDGSIVVCSSGPKNGDRIYLMNMATGAIKFLADTDAQDLTSPGTPRPRFIIDNQHLIFGDDRTGTPQVVTLSGFTNNVP